MNKANSDFKFENNDIIMKNSEKAFKVIEASDELNDKIEKYVINHRDAAIYHHPDWVNCLARESNQKSITLICVNSLDEIIGIMPLLTTKGLPLGFGGLVASKRISSLPRTPVAGPLADSVDVENLLIDATIELMKQNPEAKLQIKATTQKYSDSNDKLVRIPWRMTYLTEIPNKENEIRFGNSRNHSAIKRAVNKAVKSGVVIREANNVNDLYEWYLLYLETMRIHLTPARSLKFFKNLWSTLKPKGYMKLSLAEINKGKEKRILAGSIYLLFNGVVTYAFNGSSRNDLDLRPNDLLHWTEIHNAQKYGFKSYDLGEVQINQQGLIGYKSKWGSYSKQIYHYYYPPNSKFNNIELDKENNNSLLKNLWQKLPLKMTAFIGEKIYNYL
jgi:Acetyltransferase (GNAT) domain